MDDLVRILGEVQRRGGIGRGPIEDAVQHAHAFVDALPGLHGRLVDLGSGGGLPGLVIAAAMPRWTIALVERRAKRSDLLRYAVAALELGERVQVLGMEAAAAASLRPWRGGCEVVTARSFGPPSVVLDAALPFLVDDGVIVVSEPPDERDRWSADLLAARGVEDLGRTGSVRRLRRVIAPTQP